VSSDTGRRYREFATREAHGRSPLYERLALGVAEDLEVIQLLDALPPAKRQPNLLFASVRFLGGMGADYRSFRKFVLERKAEVLDVVREHGAQTNEVGRCATLLPVLSRLEGPLALIEIGASAGLCLLLDRYRYRYDERTVGDPSSPVVLACRTVGHVPIPSSVLEVVWRHGLDIAPLDVALDADMRWLEACVWPDQTERLARLRAAIDLARREPPVVEPGDAVERTAELVAQAPAGTTIVVFHSALMPYLSEKSRLAFGELVRGLPVTWISNEGAGGVPSLTGPWIDMADERGAFVVADGSTVLALSDPHGTWLEWVE
jgi:hypothetical protein